MSDYFTTGKAREAALEYKNTTPIMYARPAFPAPLKGGAPCGRFLWNWLRIEEPNGHVYWTRD